MTLPPAKRRELEQNLGKLAIRLKDSPTQAGTLITKAVERAGLTIFDIKIVIDPSRPDTIDDRLEKMERYDELMKKLGTECKWDVFIHACATKVDLQTKWRPKIIEAVSEGDMMTERLLSTRERIGYVPYEWLEKVMAMPDLDPNEYIPRSNYAEVCEPLESTLRGAGRTPNWIAKTLTDFIARFNGRHVTVADVRFPKGKPSTKKEEE